MDLIKTTENKKLIYKAISGSGVKQMTECVGETFRLTDIIQEEITKDNGETAIITALVSESGEVYQTLSPTVRANCETIWKTFDIHNEEVNVVICEGVAGNSGRNYLYIDVEW